MKDMISLVDIAFIVDKSWAIDARSSRLIILNCKMVTPRYFAVSTDSRVCPFQM